MRLSLSRKMPYLLAICSISTYNLCRLRYLFDINNTLVIIFMLLFLYIGYVIYLLYLTSVVPDPWHFETGSDPWIRILLFSPVAFRMAAKNIFFSTWFLAYFFLRIHVHCTPVVTDNNSLRSHKTVEIKVFLNFVCLLMEGAGSVQIITGGPKTTGS